MSDFIIGSIVLVVFVALFYNLLIKKKTADCHSSPSCAGCAETRHSCDDCSHASPEALKEELRKMLHNG